MMTRYTVTTSGRREASILRGWFMDGDMRWMLKYIKNRKTPASPAEVLEAYLRATPGMSRSYATRKFKLLVKTEYIKQVE